MATVKIHKKTEPATAEAATLAAPAPATASVLSDVREHTVTDPRGRSITLKKPTALDRMRLALIVGAEAADNPSFMLYANLGSSVSGVDGRLLRVNSQRELDAIVQELDEDGLAAVFTGWREAGWIGAATEEAASEHTAAVKN